jgi:hypothetical protein
MGHFRDTDIFSAANDASAAAAAEFKSAAAFKRPIRAASLDAACNLEGNIREAIPMVCEH